MASLNLHSLLSLSSKPSLSPQTPASAVCLWFSPSLPSFKKAIFSIKSSMQAPTTVGGIIPTITLTDTAVKQLNMMRFERNEHFCIRIGAKKGGCSGNLSYTIEFEGRESSRVDDCAIEYEGFVIVCDPESLVVLRGVQLDYNDAAPSGGGFIFKNPNATLNCGCCKSLCCRDSVVYQF